jgi:SAM-dependent methyltransferase
MAVLWMEPAANPAGNGNGRLAEALTARGLELRTWWPGCGAELPEHLDGVEAVVVAGEVPAGDGDPPGASRGEWRLRLVELLRLADEAELPVLVVRSAAGAAGDGAGADGGGDSDRDGYDLDAEAAARFAERVAAGRYPALTRAFFTRRAVGWEKKFPDDEPIYRAAVGALGLEPGQVAVDAGCGTGRAVPLLREAVGPGGTVLGVDLTPAMAREAVRLGRGAAGTFAVADCLRLPLRDATVDAVFAAGLVPHVPQPVEAFQELARVVRDGGRLALFHPVGRAVVAARHGRTLGPDDPLAEQNLRPALREGGWRLNRYEDHEDRFLAVAVRGTGATAGARP